MLAAPFDRIAESYDAAWTSTAAGTNQRDAVWRVLDKLFAGGCHILDVGCGTGADAVHLISRGVRVTAIDPSAAMVSIACAKGIDARQIAIEELDGSFDGAMSNFGALNCVEDLAATGRELARLIRPSGHLAICLIARFCLRETLHFLRLGQARKAVRRWRGRAASSLGLTVHYPTVRRVVRSLSPHFTLQSRTGIGLLVPPSYITQSDDAIARLSRIDQHIAHWPVVRAAADHHLLVFRRN